MNGGTVTKLLLVMAGIVVFLTGMRLQNESMRWIGIGLVAASWFLRFLGPKSPDSDKSPQGDQELG